MIHARVVLVADIRCRKGTSSLSCDDLEKADPTYVTDLTGCLESIGCDVLHIEHPQDLLGLKRSDNDVVLSIWSGRRSRNRRALVPALCETLGLRYVGGDAYAQVVCSDKVMAKRLARDIGFTVAESVTVERPEEIPLVYQISPPVVVKPSLEGGSIGISDSSLAFNGEEAAKLARELLAVYQQPILVERFVPGDEMTISLLGSHGDLQRWAATRLDLSDAGLDVSNRLFGFETKKDHRYTKRWVAADEVISEQTITSCAALFSTLRMPDILRVDGRVCSGEFVLIEITPDIHLGPHASFVRALMDQGMTYEDILEHVIRFALDDNRSECANTRERRSGN